MGSRSRRQVRSLLILLGIILLLTINIRVEAGVATVLERAVDGLAGAMVLLISIYLALRFFGDQGKREGGQGQRPREQERRGGVR